MGIVIINQRDIPPMTEEEIAQLEEAAKRPIVYDEDCPELTPEMLRHARRASGKLPPRPNPAEA